MVWYCLPSICETVYTRKRHVRAVVKIYDKYIRIIQGGVCNVMFNHISCFLEQFLKSAVLISIQAYRFLKQLSCRNINFSAFIGRIHALHLIRYTVFISKNLINLPPSMYGHGS